MIKINNNIKEKSCFLYNPQDKLVGEIKNYLAFLDVRVKIKLKSLEGYYILFKNNRYYIDKSGKLPVYPNNLFSLLDDNLALILG